MHHIQNQKEEISVRINGGDRRTSIISVFLVCGCLLLSLALAMLLTRTTLETIPVLIGGITILFFFASIYGTLYLVKNGTFSRFLVTIYPNKAKGDRRLKCIDRLQNQTLFDIPFRTDRLYIAETKIQTGYVSRKFKALCYGPVSHEFVKDKKPSPDFILFLLGEKAHINALYASIESLCKP